LDAYLADPTDKNEFDAIKTVVKKAWDTYGHQDVWVQDCFFYIIIKNIPNEIF
jgi:hypothetical protein